MKKRRRLAGPQRRMASDGKRAHAEIVAILSQHMALLRRTPIDCSIEPPRNVAPS